MPDVPPLYLRFMRPAKPLWADINETATKLVDLDMVTDKLMRHRVFGLSVGVAYWPDSWQDAWAIEELLKWEGREDEIRRDQYYADFIVGEDQPSSTDEQDQLDMESLSRVRAKLVSRVRESVHRRDVDAGPDVRREIEQPGVLRLERGVSGGYARGVSGEDGD